MRGGILRQPELSAERNLLYHHANAIESINYAPLMLVMLQCASISVMSNIMSALLAQTGRSRSFFIIIMSAQPGKGFKSYTLCLPNQEQVSNHIYYVCPQQGTDGTDAK